MTYVRSSPDKEQSMTNYEVHLAYRLHYIHHDARRRLRVASDGMNARFDRLANAAAFQGGVKV